MSIKKYLDEILPNRWLGSEDPTKCLIPHRSSCLTPMTLFLLGIVKTRSVSSVADQAMNKELKTCIRMASAKVDNHTIAKSQL
jgi:hypothetical protein